MPRPPALFPLAAGRGSCALGGARGRGRAPELVGDDFVQQLDRRVHALLAVALRPALADLVEVRMAQGPRGLAALGEPDDLRAAIIGIRNALDVATLLELRHDLADGLL